MSSKKSREKLRQLYRVIDGKSNMLVVLQDNPDPDALGAAMALRKLANARGGVACSITCGGVVGRAENRAMVRYLDVNLRPLEAVEPARFDVIAMVDTQPGTGNNSLPDGLLPAVVIDHHPIRRETRSVAFTDVRSRYGATCTILSEYLQVAGMEPDAQLATALLYGIRSDTQDLGREATKADMEAFGRLYPLANKRMLGDIRRGQVPSEYFQVLARALDQACLCGRSIYSDLGDLDNPDMVGEVADILLRHQEAQSSLCWGIHDGRLLLSVRTTDPDLPANVVARSAAGRGGSGGGHKAMAGGQVPMADSSPAVHKKIAAGVLRRFLKASGNASCKPRPIL